MVFRISCEINEVDIGPQFYWWSVLLLAAARQPRAVVRARQVVTVIHAYMFE